jgi:AcrR family transcriptional regulator
MAEEKREDRRVQRTRQLLRHALVELILEKGYEAVTVQDITDRANVGRSTFYAHFSDKEELLVSGFDELKSAIVAQRRAARGGRKGTDSGRLDFGLALFEHAHSHRHLYQAMVGRESGAALQNKMRRLVTQLTRDDLASLAPPDSRGPGGAFEGVVHFVVGAFLGLLIWWLDSPRPLPPAEVDELFRRLAVPGIAAGLGVRQKDLG